MVEKSAATYVGKLRLRKVDPPARIMGGGAGRRVIFLENPFLDFVGVWTECGGRAVFIECKSTAKPKLTFDSDGGITTTQLDALRNWHNAGAVAFVLWQWGERVRMVTAALLAKCRDEARFGTRFKFLDWEDFGIGHDIPAGEGWCMVDFRREMWARWK